MAESSQANLLAFLRKQRWFAAKGGAPSDARVIDSVVVPWGDGRFSLARVAVRVGDADQCYQLAMATDGSRFDVTDNEEFRRGLVDALQRSASAETNGLRWVAEAVPGVAPIGDVTTKLGSAEQSNTSLIVGDRAIVKLFRMLRPGVHPDAEVTRFLTTRAGFANTPRLLADASLEKGSEIMTAAMMQELVPGATDAWSYALERGRPYFAAPKGREMPNAFVDDARRLGEITRAMHDALASDEEDPAFAPEDVEPEDLDRWAHRTQQMIRDAIALLERAIATPDFPKDRLPEAQALIRRRDHYVGWINEIDDTIGDDVGLRIRVHGDYHLGQVLRSSSREFMVIDFEGEPSRTLDERREKTSALRDVAGMLRSFGYAAATLAMSVEKSHDMPTREIRVGRWERDVRAAFLEGYLEASDDDAAEFLPQDPAHVRQLITMFEAEKAFYELAYELNNRPSWAWIPMRGITKLFVA